LWPAIFCALLLRTAADLQESSIGLEETSQCLHTKPIIVDKLFGIYSSEAKHIFSPTFPPRSVSEVEIFNLQELNA
jgi:hypothetical protein